MKRICGIIILVSLTVMLCIADYSQKCNHPGIDQTSDDLAYMKKQVLAGNQPWKDEAEILRYTNSGGQCQESTRDQAHVQLGLGEFAGAARVA